MAELDGIDWGDPEFDSHLVTECHRLRQVPLRDLQPEDLRLLIGQQIGLQHVVPLALEALTADPWTFTDLLPGDLLSAVLSIPRSFWNAHPELGLRWEEIAAAALLQAEAKGSEVGEFDPETVRRLRRRQAPVPMRETT